MQKNYRLQGQLYWVLLELKVEYEQRNESFKKMMDFHEYSKNRILVLFDQSFEWLLEDERESSIKAQWED